MNFYVDLERPFGYAEPEHIYSIHMGRRILHIDMDAFFASVEVVRNPALRGKPLIIGGGAKDTRGVVSTASYEARKYGIHSAMPIMEARRRCPHGIFLRGNYAAYQEASEQVRAILETVSPWVEGVSIDEAYIDITGSQKLFGGDDAIAAYLKSRIRAETQLPCTIGIAPNKLVAKVATDAAKPNGYLRIEEGRERAFLHPLPIGRLPGIGPHTEKTLVSLGVSTIGQLAGMPTDRLMRVFGPSGCALQQAAQGISTSPVVPFSWAKSVGRETTFDRDLLDWKQIEPILFSLAERALYALREKQMETRRVTLKVRYGDFSTCTFAQTLPDPTCIDADIHRVLKELIPKARERRACVRLIGVTLSSLTFKQHQLPLFGGERAQRWERVLENADHIRGRYGLESLRFGSSMV